MNCGECGNVTAPGVGFPNHVYCKRFLLHMEKQEDASRCRYFIPTPITNADRIRGMSDEQFAHWLVERVTESPWCKPDAPVDPETKRCQIWDCEKCALEWLRQEAEPCTK